MLDWTDDGIECTDDDPCADCYVDPDMVEVAIAAFDHAFDRYIEELASLLIMDTM